MPAGGQCELERLYLSSHQHSHTHDFNFFSLNVRAGKLKVCLRYIKQNIVKYEPLIAYQEIQAVASFIENWKKFNI